MTYKILRSLLALVKPSEKAYENLVVKLSEHYSPIPSKIIQRFKFQSNLVNQWRCMYISELRSLAEFCNFGQTLEVMSKLFVILTTMLFSGVY